SFPSLYRPAAKNATAKPPRRGLKIARRGPRFLGASPACAGRRRYGIIVSKEKRRAPITPPPSGGWGVCACKTARRETGGILIMSFFSRKPAPSGPVEYLIAGLGNPG